MAVYLCRWPNGEVSIVQARNKTEAVERLDAFDNAEYAVIWRRKDLLLNLRLGDDGELQLGQIGGGCEMEIPDRAYRKLEEAWKSDEMLELDWTSDEYREKVREMVEHERTRLWEAQKRKKVRPPKTELGKRIQKQTGAASSAVDRWIEEIGEDILDKLDDETLQ